MARIRGIWQYSLYFYGLTLHGIMALSPNQYSNNSLIVDFPQNRTTVHNIQYTYIYFQWNQVGCINSEHS